MEMTKEQAIEAMVNGYRVTHNYFLDEEYIFMKDGEIYSEDGVCHGGQFWDLKSGEEWSNGWYLD